MQSATPEVSAKLSVLRLAIEQAQAGAIRLRGSDWFAWATAGASNTVLLTAETGVAEVLVTADDAWVLTDAIEARRLIDEELPAGYEVHVTPWIDAAIARSQFVARRTDGQRVLSDRPEGDEQALPDWLLAQRYVLSESERARYREIGRDASQAMTDVLCVAQPNWTEAQLAGAGAEALWSRGLEPALTLAAGSRRLELYRHPTPRIEPLGRSAMLVFCARGHGLIANLTRFVNFGRLDATQQRLHRQVAEIEAAALAACKIDAPLASVYEALDGAYQRLDHAEAIEQHHQGGLTGYLAREVMLQPTTGLKLQAGMALALNPSLTGAKIEDTFLLDEAGRLENLTLDDEWPTETVDGRSRPLPMERL